MNAKTRKKTEVFFQAVCVSVHCSHLWFLMAVFWRMFAATSLLFLAGPLSALMMRNQGNPGWGVALGSYRPHQISSEPFFDGFSVWCGTRHWC